jgi:hypothetical protein
MLHTRQTGLALGPEILTTLQKPLILIVRANPKPKVTIRHSHGQGALAAAKTGAPVTATLLKTERAMIGIFFPEAVCLARGGAGGR